MAVESNHNPNLQRKRDDWIPIDPGQSSASIVDEMLDAKKSRKKSKTTITTLTNNDMLPLIAIEHMDEVPEEEPCEIEKALDNPTEVEDWESTVSKEYVGETLTTRQQKFCELYALDMDFFGNGVQAYLEVYDIDQSKPNWYKTACACSSQLLSNPKVYTRINELLESNGMNDQFIDKQLLFLASQHDDKTNKLGAIKEYNKLKKRITDKIELGGEGEKAKKEFFEAAKAKVESMNADELHGLMTDLLG